MCIDLTVICLNKVYYVYTTKWRRVDHYDVHCAISIIIASYKLLFGKCNHLFFFFGSEIVPCGSLLSKHVDYTIEHLHIIFFWEFPSLCVPHPDVKV